MTQFFNHGQAKKSSPALKKTPVQSKTRRVSIPVSTNLQNFIDAYKEDSQQSGFEYTDTGVLETMIQAGAKLWMAQQKTKREIAADQAEKKAQLDRLTLIASQSTEIYMDQDGNEVDQDG